MWLGGFSCPRVSLITLDDNRCFNIYTDVTLVQHNSASVYIDGETIAVNMNV